MSRAANPDEYVLRVNAKRGVEVRRFCEVHVKGDDVYVFQPRKGNSVKSSYHESGQQHVKIGRASVVMPPMRLDPPRTILTEENPWSSSFENFAALLPYQGNRTETHCEIDLPTDVDALTFVQICIGRSFDSSGWTMDGVDLVVIMQEVFSVPQSRSGLQLCVRVVRVTSSAYRR